MKLPVTCLSFFLCLFTIIQAKLKVGATVVDITPKELPVLINGGFLSRSTENVSDPIFAKALVLSDSKTEIAIVVVDSCMMPRPFLDETKNIVTKKTGIKSNHILISATHTHTAPSALSCLGTKADPRYITYLRTKIIEAIVKAQSKLQPAKLGWNQTEAPEFTAVRRWVRRPDRIEVDPFGNQTVRANMHAGRNWNDVTGESGPEDPDLSMISIQTLKGKPLAILANFSMHYFGGVKPISSDYFGLFASYLREKLKANEDFVGIMSHGCSGDIWRRDYTLRDWSIDPLPNEEQMQIENFAKGLAERALKDYRKIKHQEITDIAMAETRMTLNYRVPDAALLQWAQKIVQEMKDRNPKNRTEVYALEQTILHERKSTEIVLQALRIGDIAIATIPNETYALTGLKLKARSPLNKTMIIELANGGDGYIPPPEQHFLGGYNTWPARSAGLEKRAEPKIVEACLNLLEQVTGKPCSTPSFKQGPSATVIANLKPFIWLRMNEFEGPFAIDEQRNRNGLYEDGVVLFLEGPNSKNFANGQINRSAHFAGGRIHIKLSKVKDTYSVSTWFWNGMPQNSRPVLGWMLSRARNHSQNTLGEHLGMNLKGALLFHDGIISSHGKTSVDRWKWGNAIMVKNGDTVRIYLNGKLEIEAKTSTRPTSEDFFLGGRNDNKSNWEGRLDEVAIFDRVLKHNEIQILSQ